MADVITRFRLETTQYDSALRSAAQQLREYGSRAMAAGNEFQKFTKGQAEAARALGNIAVAANNPKDKVRELVAAFNDAAKAYNALSKEQQKSDWGKALAESIQTLKGRISEAKQELYSVKETSTETGNIIEQLASKFGISTKALMGWGAAIAAGKVALDVAKDAFLSSESNIDEWGRTCKGAEIAYDQLLQSLNQGSWSNFFKNISDAYAAGVNLYNVLDRMGSVRANNQFAISESEANLTELRVQLKKAQNAKDEALADTLKKQILALEESIKELKQQNVGATRNAGVKSVETIRNSSCRATTGGRVVDMATVEKFIQDYGKSGQKVFDNASKVVSELEAKGTRTVSSVISKGTTSTGMSLGSEIVKENIFDIKNLTEAEQYQYAWAKAIKERETALKEATAILVDSNQQRQSIAQQEFQVQRWTGAGGSGGSGGGGGSATTVAKELNPMQQAQKEISALSEEALTADEGRLEIIKKEIAALQEQVKVYQSIQDYVNGKQPNFNITVGDKKAFEQEQRQRFEAAVSGVTPKLSENNMSAFLATLKQKIAQSDLGSTLYNNLTAQLADATALANLMQTAIKNGIDVSQFNPQDLWKKVFSENPGDYISDKTWQSIQEAINVKLKEMKLEPIELDFKSGSVSTPKSSTGGNVSQDMKGTFQSVQQMVGYVASINNDLKNLGVEVPEGFSKVVSIINLIQTTMAAAQAAQTISSATSSIPVVGGIIGLIAGIATSFKKGGIVHAANGFVVPGNSFSGDNVPALLDSGELVLNRAQQGNLASQLTYANGRNGSQESEVLISSENIRIIMKNGAMRRGMSVAEYLKL